MSFQRLSYDRCAYDERVNDSAYAGQYMLMNPLGCTKSLFVEDPQIHMSKNLSSWNNYAPNCTDINLVDVDSELSGMNQTATKCRDRVWKKCKDVPLGAPTSEGADVAGEFTRLSNPAANIRGETVNRWEWLPCDPQMNATTILPFEINGSSRLISKDNHIPCVRPVKNQTNPVHSAPNGMYLPKETYEFDVGNFP
jgi:hypothetical protein